MRRIVTLLRERCRNIFFEKVIHFSEMLRFELLRGLVTQRAMKTFVIALLRTGIQAFV
jgi:hypothetical protein